MNKLGLSVAGAGLLTALASLQADAAPTCTSTITNPTGGIASSSLPSGVCVQSADKLFGNFTFGNLPPTTVNFSVTNPSSSEEDHNLSFTASFQQGVTYTSLGFEVEINPPTAGTVITTLKGDFTQTSSTTSTLTKNSTPTGTPAGGINETKVGSTPSGTLSITYSPGVQDIIVSESLVDNGTIQNILDTVIESGSFTTSTPEPGSLMLLGSALAGMGLLGRRRRKAL